MLIILALLFSHSARISATASGQRPRRTGELPRPVATSRVWKFPMSFRYADDGLPHAL